MGTGVCNAWMGLRIICDKGVHSHFTFIEKLPEISEANTYYYSPLFNFDLERGEKNYNGKLEEIVGMKKLLITDRNYKTF